jgi:ligand-binding SRPBCC domain-containing protein
MHYQLKRQQFFPYPREEIFAFFAEAHNLEAITPGFLHLRILTPPPIAMQAGMLIDYTLRPFGVPLQWQTRIEPSNRRTVSPISKHRYVIDSSEVKNTVRLFFANVMLHICWYRSLSPQVCLDSPEEL